MPASIPVFCYHNVSQADGHTPQRFEEHLEAIRDAGFHTISARELVAALRGQVPVPEKACVLTFDDCHLSNWTMAVPLLVKYDMRGVFFCVTDFIGQGRRRGQASPDSESGEGGPELLTAPASFRAALEHGDMSQFMNEAELISMVRDYGFEVYAHSSRHQGCFRSMVQVGRLGAAGAGAHWSSWGILPPELRQQGQPLFEVGSAYAYNGWWPCAAATGSGVMYRRRSDAERRAFCLEDFRRCHARMAELNAASGQADAEQFLCWPWGHYDQLSEDCAREAGFSAAFSLERNANTTGTDPMRIHRLGVGKNKNGAWIKSRLNMYSGSLKARVFFKFFTKRPDVASVVYMTDSTSLSGGSRQMFNNISGMRESGVRVTVVLPPDSEMAPALAPMTTGENPVEVVEFGGFRQYVRAASFVRDLTRRVDADVVHTFHAKAYKSAAIAKLWGGRFRLFINRGVIFAPNAIFSLYALLATGITCNSLKCAQVLRQFLVPQNRLRLIYNSFLPEGGTLPPERAPHKKRGARVLYVGNLAPAKGFDVFVKVAQELVRRGQRDLEYVAAGVLHEEPWQDMVPPEVRPRLAVLGRLSHDRVLEELMAADILVLCSRQESLPNVLLEAFACSLPVVCTAVGGMPELVHNGINGFLAPSEDAAALADAVAELAVDPELRLRMGAINRRLVAQHLDGAAKTLALLRVYSGEQLFEPLPIDELARQVAAGCPAPSAIPAGPGGIPCGQRQH